MHRCAIEIPVVAIFGGITAVMILIGGTAIAPDGETVTTQSLSIEWTGEDPGACFDAPVTPHTAPTVDGEARLCTIGRDVQVRLRVGGLTPGKLYTASLSYVAQPTGCRDVPCGASDFFADEPVGLLEQIGSGVASPSGTLELSGELNDLQPVSGAQVTLLVLRPRTPTGLVGQAVFVIP